MLLTIHPALPGFEIEMIELNDQIYTVIASATKKEAICPDCHAPSTSVHSWYQRHPRDLPSIGQEVHLELQVRRFFCRNKGCPRRVFCERLPELVEKYARGTQRLIKTLTTLAFALGGKEGERVVPKLGMPASRDTLLRLIRKQSDPEQSTPRVVGIDDWAFRKAHTYGTLICDLEQGTVIDLLPDREAKTVAEWFKAHPTVEIVTRDRSKTYAAGVAEGAPQAIQVADRWHLASNLVDALETTLANTQANYGRTTAR